MNDERDENLLRTLVSVETRGWQALSDTTGADYYEQHLTENAIMVFPFGMLSRQQAIETIRAAPPWASFRIEEPRIVALSQGSAVLTYRATAQRAGEAPYVAIMSTVFTQTDDRWMTAFHQQSPLVESN